MASQTCELPPVAYGAGFLVQPGVLSVVHIEKPRSMIRRLERGSSLVAELATEGRVDLAMTDQAVGHLRQIRFRQSSRLLHSPMARGAWVAAVQMPPDIARRRQVGFRIDSRPDDRGEISHRQV